MGIYWLAVDERENLVIYPPNKFSIKTPCLFHYKNPFSVMIIMKNTQGYNFEITNDMKFEITDEYKDVTDEVFEEYLSIFPDGKNFYCIK